MEKNPVLDRCVANLIRETKEIYYNKGVEDILKSCESEFNRGRRKGHLQGVMLATLVVGCGYLYGMYTESKSEKQDWVLTKTLSFLRVKNIGFNDRIGGINYEKTITKN